MRKFLKFIVSIIVIVIMIFTVYFFMQYSNQYTPGNENNGEKGSLEYIKSGENNFEYSQNENENNTQSGDLVDGNIIIEEISGENTFEEITSGDTSIENASGDIFYTAQEIEMKITAIKDIENQNKSISVPKTFEDSVGLDIIGVNDKDFFTAFNLTELSVTIQIAGSMVYIIPNSDFIDNAQYHYDENGNLVLYICELIGVGGEIRYYYENGQFLKQEQIIEEEIEIEGENVLEILQRSKLVYEKYIK